MGQEGNKIMRILIAFVVVLAAAGALGAADGKLMHCFYFTEQASATADDWAAFARATEALPGEIEGLHRVWHGKLRRPMRAGDNQRQYGVCMEMTDEAALKTYADHPAHKAWEAVYGKVRVPGTTTVDIVGK